MRFSDLPPTQLVPKDALKLQVSHRNVLVPHRSLSSVQFFVSSGFSDLSDNQLTALHKEAFDGMDQLKHL